MKLLTLFIGVSLAAVACVQAGGGERPQADDIRRPPPEGGKQTWGGPAFAREAPAALDAAPQSLRSCPQGASPALGRPGGGLEPIQCLIAGAACQNDSQCRVIGVGAAACGGPDGYRAWSALATDERALQDAVAAQAAARRRENERLGRMSTCMVLPEPGVRCEPAPQPVAGGLAAAGRCVLLPGSGVLPRTLR